MRHGYFTRLLPIVSLVAAGVVAGCNDDDITVPNENQPDVERAYATPGGVELIISKLFQQMHQGLWGNSSSIWPGAATMSFESASQLGNFGMGARGALPRAGIDNQRGNSYQAENFRVFDHLTRNARSAGNAINALDRFKTQNASIGSAQRDDRARSFAYFALGFGLGYISLFYDSAAVVTPDVTATLTEKMVPPFSGSKDAFDAAMKMLDSAFKYANTTNASGMTLPGTGGSAWVLAGADVSQARYVQIIRSYRAKFRANYARSKADRDAAALWNAVIPDATNGITTDLNITLSPTDGWTNAWIQQNAVSTGWHQMPLFMIGMADTTGAYDAWLQTSLMQRTPFLIRTPDTRFPSGETRALQQAKTPSPFYPPLGSTLYFRNRPTGNDTPAEPWGTSFYDLARFFGIRGAGGVGNFPIMTVAEIDLLAAEGYIKTNQPALAVPLVNKYRTKNGLPAIVAADLTTPVPGGNACVPRVPQPPTFTTTACGSLYEAMKYEKRMETAITGFGQWYLDSRGWGDLAENTPLEWPVPYQERDARSLPFYNSNTQAPKGTYGY